MIDASIIYRWTYVILTLNSLAIMICIVEILREASKFVWPSKQASWRVSCVAFDGLLNLVRPHLQ